eukprot:jgi/Hompol1/6077/HPOL_002209-RA
MRAGGPLQTSVLQTSHDVTVFSVAGTECDVVVPSLANPFYDKQRVFVLPPWQLMMQLLDFSTPVPYDIAHIVAPLCLSFVFVLPFLKMRGVKIYVSYHVYLEYYRNHYVGSHPLSDFITEFLFTLLYYIPLVWLADCVGIPSKTADNYVFKYSHRIHYLKSGLDTTNVFVPKRIRDESDAGTRTLNRSMSRSSGKLIETPASTSDLQIKDLRQFAGVDKDDSPLLIYVGRLAMEKNVEFLVQAMAHPSMATATLVIVGDGPSKPGLEDLARSVVGAEHVYSPPSADSPSTGSDLASADAQTVAPSQSTSHMASPQPALDGVRKRIVFTGMVLNENQVASYYGQSDIFVSASASETFGFTVAEAMACGTPAVVVRSGAFKTVYKLIDSWMFNENSISEYVARINAVHKQGRSARRLARDIAVRGFSVESAIRDVLQTYWWIVDGCPNTKQSS